ncbi:ATP-binding protein [Spirillospora sp. NPDC048911]|uniref:ATP-binding protein n=1 Tax=Spirillospora sp. NPDC048911 TaxID=3364527 RepID=UPI00371C1D18
MNDDMTPLSETVDGYRASAPAALQQALERVAHETPEQAAEALAKADAEALREAAQERATYRRRRYEDARPKAYAFACYDHLLPQQDPGGRGRGWLASGHKNALLVGPSGHGKTHLAYTIGNDAVARGLWVEAWSVSELLQALSPLPTHARFDEARSRRQELIGDAVKECELLILDDLGVEVGSGYVADRNIETLSDVLTARDSNPDCRTVITLNGPPTADLPAEEERQRVKAEAANSIANRYGARLATRLQNDMVGIWIEGECFRRPATWNPFS